MKNTSQASFLPVVHELARTYQAFEQFASQHIRQLGLTPPQFDVVATLGHSKGMNCKELSDRTLITKGTLTGVIDRLEDKGLVTRTMQPNDRRSVFVSLTQHGERLFDQAFPAHIDYMQIAFKRFGEHDLSGFCQELGRLREGFSLALEEQEEVTA
ncbi:MULTISPECIES: MarR family winged helix-turn-helix transcriptional regulator [Chromobacterium]|uniref:MarR family transcriptional regulator n=3 Tax=Chromobacterium TaxID=535 RepID=A0A1W0CZH6_9NEIS|nr:MULTISPECIES: MarR family transcriptional regulator [Chromobacterium]AXT45231.1 MarR family transcriptional regulator [Chromobacterium rhizoryzae]KMN36014.1 MarR family transcriptional regulator [Chromobacterium sp. LK1]KMN81573.1 MarR family transcriptional regulator [Chromobacterium sp. LK11]MBK0416603.1 MarR family transcriptional regulator [Chromobacterium haemolyticum]MBN3006449.1 MarR family transcriptional regulator [Chromobacterium alkanivorans]